MGNTTAKEAWEGINRNFAGKSKSRIMELQTRLHNLRKGTMLIDDYVQLVRSLGDELRVSGSIIDGHDPYLHTTKGPRTNLKSSLC